MSELANERPVELTDRELNDVQGGLLLPAVQKVREAAARLAAGDGSVLTAAD